MPLAAGRRRDFASVQLRRHLAVRHAGELGEHFPWPRPSPSPRPCPRSPSSGSIMSTFRNCGTGGKAADPAIPNPSSVLAAGTSGVAKGFVGPAARSYFVADDQLTPASLPDDR